MAPSGPVQSGLAAFHDYDFEFSGSMMAGSSRQLDGFSLVILAKANMVSADNKQPWLTMDSQTVFFDYMRSTGGFLRHPKLCKVEL